MTAEYPSMLYTGGLYADPEKITKLARFLVNATTPAVANSLLVKTSAGLLLGLTVSSVSAQFIQVFDSETLPANGAIPTLSYAIGATNHLGIVWWTPRGFRNGIAICNSSTQHTKTIGSADCLFDVQFL